MTIDQALDRLGRSSFRCRFHLTAADKAYYRQKGEAIVRSHAETFVRERLAPAEPLNDGGQTPMRGHPVFKAMHATACCCRGCLAKWYRVPKGVPLSSQQQTRIVNLLMAWIAREMLG